MEHQQPKIWKFKRLPLDYVSIIQYAPDFCEHEMPFSSLKFIHIPTNDCIYEPRCRPKQRL